MELWLVVVKSEYIVVVLNYVYSDMAHAVCGFLLTIARQWMTILIIGVIEAVFCSIKSGVCPVT